MKLRAYILALLTVLAAGMIGLFTVTNEPAEESVDLAVMNDVVMRLQRDFDSYSNGQAQLPECDIDYVLFAPDGRPLAATADDLAQDFSSALRSRYTVLDITAGDNLRPDNMVIGRVAFAVTSPEALIANATVRHRTVAIAVLAAIVACVSTLLWRVYTSLLRPFRQMKDFARRVAAGNLDMPLAMDRANAFGAFTESFDLMRTELAEARAREAAAEVSKRELVASLSHDIKTHVSSIKAVAELGQIRPVEEASTRRFATINAKADQIDLLITNMFSASLDDLESLEVVLADVPSTELAQLIIDADYRHLIGDDVAAAIPDCLIVTDPLRLGQVVDNIVANSYKYADTRIGLCSWIEDDTLSITFTDSGPGAAPDELPLLASKFFRGQDSAGKPGAGLGLYLASNFMSAFGGGLEYTNSAPGLSVRLVFQLVSTQLVDRPSQAWSDGSSLDRSQFVTTSAYVS